MQQTKKEKIKNVKIQPSIIQGQGKYSLTKKSIKITQSNHETFMSV